jgi:hypothetical protein
MIDKVIIPCHEVGNAINNLNAIDNMMERNALSLAEIQESVRREADRLLRVLNILRAKQDERQKRR